MIIKTSGRTTGEKLIPLTVDLSKAVYIRVDGDGDCVIFYSMEIGNSGLIGMLAPRPLTVCVLEQVTITVLR